MAPLGAFLCLLWLIPYSLNSEYLLFLLLCRVFQFMDVIVGELLDFRETVLLVVFGDGLILQHFLQLLISVTADVADGGPVIFKDGVYVLRVLLAAVFGERW